MESLSIHDLTAAYALDALEPDDARAYEEHLATCKTCQEELARLGGAAGALAFAVESPAPAPQLRQRILDAAAGERQKVVPLRPRWTVAAKVAVAAAACLAVGSGVWATALSRSLDRERSARQQADIALAIASDPAATRTALRGEAGGSLVVAASGEAALVVSRLDMAPAGKTYEAWVIEHGKPLRAGTFAGGGDTTVLRLQLPVPSGAEVAVTIERKPGASRPSGPMVLRAKPI